MVMLSTRLLRGIVKTGRLTVNRANGRTEVFGDGTGPWVTIRFTSRRAERKALLRWRLGVGEAYMDGGMVIEDGSLQDFLALAAANMAYLNRTWHGRIAMLAQRWLENWRHINPIGRSRRNVAHHYDLKPELFTSFLDSDLQYSCGYFASPDDDIETAQSQKKAHIAAKLRLAPGQKILDIGSGWGGLGLYLAQGGDCAVTGITLSTEQQKIANRRARAAGLADRVKFELRDYRHQAGQFDRIASVGMFEHVGRIHYQTYFNRIADLLTDDGICLLHTIGSVAGHQPINSWMRKYIFPGAYLPSLSELLPAIERAGLWVTDFENLRFHYAYTLERWNERFQARRSDIAEMYDERFCRMWEFYLVGCRMAFLKRGLTVFQLQLTKRPDAVPMTRDYMYAAAGRDSPALAPAALHHDRPAA